MSFLRASRCLTRLVLVWFALALGAAIASPLVKPQRLELVCSADGGARFQPSGDADGDAPARHLLDCALCLPAAPPSESAVPVPLVAHAGGPVPLRAGVAVTASSGAPLPARGPPAIS